jgi:hypothetical protein
MTLLPSLQTVCPNYSPDSRRARCFNSSEHSLVVSDPLRRLIQCLLLILSYASPTASSSHRQLTSHAIILTITPPAPALIQNVLP